MDHLTTKMLTNTNQSLITKMYAGKAKTITDGTSEAEVFNIIGQLRSLERIKASGELENKTEKKEQITNDLGAKSKV